MGELLILDPARGRREAEGAVQRVPGWGRKLEPVVLDLPIARSLAQVPPSFSAERQVLPGIVQACGRYAVGDLPSRCF